MRQMAHFLYFLLIKVNPVTVWTKYLSASERSHLALFKNFYNLLGSKLLLSRGKPLKIQDLSILLLTYLYF